VRSFLILLVLLLASAGPARSQLREIRSGDSVSLRPDRAYVLFRTLRPRGVVPNAPVFLRIPTDQELARYRDARRRAFEAAEPALIRRYEADLQRRRRGAPAPQRPSLETFNFVSDDLRNVDTVDLGRSYLRGRPESLYLIEVLPGDYVIYGVSYGGGGGALNLCMCLGTVGFAAEPGVITDLGYFLSDRVHEVSALPELREESGFGPSSYGMFILWGATVRPARPDSTVPEALRALPIRSARYRAVGRFVEPRALAINRLAPVPGILEYREGRVIDAATGREVPDVQ
jgi:hypothetical protein